MRVASGPDFDVIIVGAGVIGLTMAGLLVAQRLAAPARIAVIAERLAPPGPVHADGPTAGWELRVFALSRASQQVLARCGAWPSAADGKLHAYERMRVWDFSGQPGGAGSVTFDCAELGEPNLGFIVEGRALHARCLEAASRAGVVFIEAGVTGIVTGDSGVRVRLADGRELGGSLLLAADGPQSPTRGFLGIGTAGHAYHQDALVAHVHTAEPHANTAWQRFLRTGPLAFLPLPDGRSSIVWSVPRNEASRLRALDVRAFDAELTAASGGVLGSCELTTLVASFPLQLQYALDYVRPRAVLLGEAAHVVHPLAGQGLNLGLLDCAALADVLGSAGSAGFAGEHRLLRRYERWRRSENLLMVSALDGLERLFASDHPVSSALRTVGLGFIERNPGIRRALAERALGLRGDIPAFLRGGPG